MCTKSKVCKFFELIQSIVKLSDNVNVLKASKPLKVRQIFKVVKDCESLN